MNLLINSQLAYAYNTTRRNLECNMQWWHIPNQPIWSNSKICDAVSWINSHRAPVKRGNNHVGIIGFILECSKAVGTDAISVNGVLILLLWLLFIFLKYKPAEKLPTILKRKVARRHRTTTPKHKQCEKRKKHKQSTLYSRVCISFIIIKL
jgi:hypothetical protein